jgi:membrane protease YdiL (CAAX protease family)
VANYYDLFVTNSNLVFAAGVSGGFLLAALLFKRSSRLARYWPITYAFFIASVVNLVSLLFAGYNTHFVRLFGDTSDQNRVEGLAKLYATLLVVIPVFGLTLLAGDDLRALLLNKGNAHSWWGWGIGFLVLVNYFTSVLIFYGDSYALPRLGSAIVWGLVFALSNSMLEELWVRGIFIKKLLPLVGTVGTVLLTSAWYAALHFTSFAFLPAFAVPIFVLNTFTLGLACGILAVKTDSIWGAYLIHAAADLFLFIAMLATH